MVINYVKSEADLRVSDVTIKMFHPQKEGEEYSFRVLRVKRSVLGELGDKKYISSARLVLQLSYEEQLQLRLQARSGQIQGGIYSGMIGQFNDDVDAGEEIGLAITRND